MINPEQTPRSSGSRLKRWAYLAEALLLVALAAVALSFHATLPQRLPKDSDYQAMAQFLTAQAMPGDCVLFFPWWAERARTYLPETLPAIGYLGSDQDSLRDFRRIWVLAQPRLPRSDIAQFERMFSPGRAPLEAPRAFGPLQLAPYRNNRFRPTFFDSASALASARVYLQNPDGSREVCPFDGKSHRCPGSGQLRVSSEWHELHYRPQRCVFLQPPGGARRLIVEFESVPIRTYLTLEAGLIWDRGWFHDPSVTALQVGVNEANSGASLLRLTLPPGTEAPQRAERATPADSPKSISVQLWVQSDSSNLRESCVNLRSEDGAAWEPG